MKHICVLICYNNVEHIKKCFNSIKNLDIDFFIIENKSENSDEISNFFINENLIGYIQFEENISFRAVEIFIKDYISLLNEYDYITISDCDLLIENEIDTFDEIISNLNRDNVMVSCVDLSFVNYPKKIDPNYTWIPKPISENQNYIECRTGIHLCTIKKQNLHLLNGTFIDSQIAQRVYRESGAWAKTKKNKAIHLTWDLYVEGNEYFNLKKNTTDIWSHKKISNYKKIK